MNANRYMFNSQSNRINRTIDSHTNGKLVGKYLHKYYFTKILVVINLVFALFTCNICAQLSILPNASITIKTSGSLYANTELHIFSNSSGSGYLADQTSGGSLSVTSNILVERYISSSGWHNVSSPVATAGTSLFSSTDLIFYYDETKVLNDWNFGWIWYPSGNFS